MSEEKERSLEENFLKLEEIIDFLEGEDVPLEEAFGAYSRGMGILKRCSDQIDRVEKQVLKLRGDGRLEEFEDGNTGI